jgi:capsular polysaccharide biosynthesis protein
MTYRLLKSFYKSLIISSSEHLPSFFFGKRFGLVPGVHNFGLLNNSPGKLYHGTRQVTNPWTARRKLPDSLNGTSHAAFLSEKYHHLPGSAVALIPGGRAFGGQGVTFDEGGYLLADPAHRIAGPNDWPQRYSFIRPPIRKLKGRWGVLTGSGSAGFFHWMMDILPRSFLINMIYPDVEKWIIPDHNLPFLKQSLEAIGLNTSELRTIGPKEHIQADELVVASNPSLPGNPPPWLMDLFNHRWKKTTLNETVTPNFFLLSRSNCNRRVIINENELLELLSPLGFERVELEKLSLYDQATHFRNAKIIIAPHGAGLTNLIHSQPTTAVLEVFGDQYVNVCFWAIADLKRTPYTYAIGTSQKSGSSLDKSSWNIILNQGNLTEIHAWAKHMVAHATLRS